MSGAPRRAVVLAAGLGSRLRPLTERVPKPLLPIWGMPMLEHTLQLLESWGVEEVAVNLHWQAERIREFLRRRRGGVRVVESYESEILGTGGVLRPLQGFLGDEPFWMVNSDIAAVVECEPLVAAFEKSGGFASAWLEPEKGVRTVEADYMGRITCYKSPSPGVEGTYTFCGLQMLGPQIFDYLPSEGFSTIVAAYEEALAAGKCVHGVAVAGSYWDDGGTVESWLRIHREVKQAARLGGAAGRLYRAEYDRLSASAQNFFCVEAGAEVGVEVKGSNAVVLRGARVEDGTELSESVVAGGSIGGVLSGVVCVAVADLGDEVLERLLGECGWTAAECGAVFLGQRGSARSFWRIHRGGESLIYISYSLERVENGRYAGHTALLQRAGVDVPAIRAEDAEACAVLVEDLGSDSLQSRMAGRRRSTRAWYGAALKLMRELHRAGSAAVAAQGVELEPAFDRGLYEWEWGLFERHTLSERYGIERLSDGVRGELGRGVEQLLAAPQVVVHRDYQSSNILYRGSRVGLIDFQGMRLGAAAYDLASLLYDAYAGVTSGEREELQGLYAGLGECEAEAAGLLHVAGVQRLIQALGAFGRLSGLGKSEFERYLMPGLELLLEAAESAGYDEVSGLAEELIAREQRRCGGWELV